MTLLPLVTVYMPTHNRCDLIMRAIDSVLAQDYPSIELIVVDDGSSDGTWALLVQLAETNKQLKIFRHEEALGACRARNLAIRHANGTLVTGLDDDDEFLPCRISQLVAGYDESFAFVCTGFLWHYGKRARQVDHNAMTITLGQQLNYNYATNQVLVSKERLLAIGGFDPQFVACQDYDTWTRLLIKFGDAKRIAGASYIIHRDDVDVERITLPTNWLYGHSQYLEKHGELMDSRHRLNQEFRRLISKHERLGGLDLCRQITAGLVMQKLRYFLSSNFIVLAKIRRRLLVR